MKKLLLISFLALLFSSCAIDPWGPQQPMNFFDSRLNGYWQLVQINGYSVSGYDTNFLYFNGNGNGLYYYYYNRRRYTERTQYWCQEGYGYGYGNGYGGGYGYGSGYGQGNELNILYESSAQPSTVDYWFTNANNVLYMQWQDRNGRNTYVYTRYPYAPW